MFRPRPTSRVLLLGLAGSLLAACSDNPPPAADAALRFEARVEAGPRPDRTGDALVDGGRAEGPRGELGPAPMVSLPQALGDAFFANPETYPKLPVRIVVAGKASAVSVSVPGASASASDPDGDGVWLAELPIGPLPDGALTLTATATAPGGAQASTSAELVIGRKGVQLTDYGVDGSALTPRLHRLGDKLYLTWTDRSSGGIATAWLRELDGAGRWKGARVQLLPQGAPVLYARTALSSTKQLGILYQSPGVPYVNRFAVVDLTGKAVVAPIDLDPAAMSGGHGGDVVWDGNYFVFTWRSSGGGKSQLFWARVDPVNGALSGPLKLLESQGGDSDGALEPITAFSIAAQGDVSVVTYVRKKQNALLGMTIPKCQYSAVKAGTILVQGFCGGEQDLTFHKEARVATSGQDFLLLFTLTDLNDPSPNPPTQIVVNRADAAGKLYPATGLGKLVVKAAEDRSEPFYLAQSATAGVLAWLDTRSYAGASGRIELYAAPVDGKLNAGGEAVIGHARFIMGTSELRGAPAGSNVVLAWDDERHGNGILDPRPEIVLDTLWY